MPPRKPDPSRATRETGAPGRENAALREALAATRHAQDRLLDTEQRLHAVIEHAPIIVFATDRAGVFTLSEGRGLQALGLAPGEVVGRSAFEVYKDFPQIVSNLQNCLAGQSINEVVQLGELVYEVMYEPKRNDAQEVVGISGVAWDVTARARAEITARDLEAQLRQSQKMETVGTLAGGIAHDFNNILSPIMGYTDLALTDLPAGHPARDDLEQVLRAARRARDLVKQILIFSRRGDQTRQPVQLHLVVNDTLKLIRSMLPSNIELSQNVVNQGDTVLADPGQMHQVIMNLATNAAFAMRDKGGVLRVELAREDLDGDRAHTLGLEPGTHVVLSVTDQGEGMDPATRHRVFEPFFTTKRPGEGTGLGLSVVHGIVHSVGGSIEVKSAPHEGATFRTYFPAAETPEEPVAEPRVATATSGSEHILIVDDEHAIVNLLRRILESRGFRVSAFTSSEEALAYFRDHADRFDAVITDQTMPRMSGTELARAVHQIRPDTPVVLTTGYVDDAAHRDGGRDIAGVAVKPYDAAAITIVLRKVLDRL
ncbi:MAG TPA: ATP-binding protein [Candidatus Krumholzibacteria bacterium]|nr:ATP-binding protein [Candidatus Krumholzibacteria bacterium]